MANNKMGRISDKLGQWEAEKNPLAPLSQSQINAYLRLSEHIGDSDFMVCFYCDVMYNILRCNSVIFYSVFRNRRPQQ